MINSYSLRLLIDTAKDGVGGQKIDRKGDFFVDLPLPVAGSLGGVLLRPETT